MADDVYVFPLSSAQERLWFLHQLDPMSSAYNMPAALRLRGPLDLALAERALAQIIARHEILRTTFDLVDGEPAQLVAPTAALTIERCDLSAMPEPLRARELERVIAREAQRPFELSEGPLLRVHCVRLGEREHVLLWVVHHSVFDGVSTNLLLEEFARLYDALAQGAPAVLAPLALQYADFAAFERKRVAQGALDAQIAYWRRELEPDQVLSLPTDRARPSVQRGRGARLFFDVPAPLTQALRALAQAQQVTLFSTLVSAYAVLLARLSSCEDVRIGTPVTQRRRPELAKLVGNFANTVVLRQRLANDPSFSSALRQMHQSVQAALAHGEAPFDRVVDALKPTRDLSRAPLCQVLFALQPSAAEAPRMRELSVEVLDLDSGAAQFDLALELVQDGAKLAGALEYDRDLFEAQSAQGFVERYLRVLESVTQAPARRVSALPIVAPQERAQLLELGQMRAREAGFVPVIAQIREQAARQPRALALEAGEQSLTYEMLWERVQGLAAALRARGAGRETRIGIALERSIDAIVALLATHAAGAAYVPIDPSYPRARIAALMESADLLFTIATRRSAAELPAHAPRMVLEELSALNARDDSGQATDATANAVSSGARGTGSPVLGAADARGVGSAQPEPGSKGVSTSTSSGVPFAESANMVQPRDTRARGGGSPNHLDHVTANAVSSGARGTGSLVLGAADARDVGSAQGSAWWGEVHPEQAAYVIPTSGSSGAPKAVVISQGALSAFVHEACRRYELRAEDRVLQFASLSFDASVEEIFPALVSGATLVLRDEALIAAPEAFFEQTAALELSVLDLPTSFFQRVMAARDAARPLSERLRLVILGGEAVRRDAVRAFRAVAGAHVRLVNSYGPTEATVVATTCELDSDRAAQDGAVPIGVALPHAQALVLDRQLEPVPMGVIGDLYLGGAGLARGYLARPQLTAAAFVPNPHASAPGERLYRTGDRARLRRDGAIEFVGRADHQVKVRGYRVELGEIEAWLAALPGVREVVVEAREERPGAAQLVAYVAGEGCESEALREALRAALPDYMVPAQIVVLADLPKSVQGKLDRRALAALPLEGLEGQRTQIGPRDERERELVAVWALVLGRSDVSVHDNFFALGGDSISALSVVAQARARGLAFSARSVFEHQTVAALARALSEVSAQPLSLPEPPLGAALPLTFIQRWFFEHAGPNPHHWNQSLWLRLRKPLALRVLQEALEAAAQRHDALRLLFERTASGWLQRDSGKARVRCVQASLPAATPEALREAADHLQRELRIDRGPLVICALFELPQAEQRLLVIAHHLVMDAVSLRVLIEELDHSCRGRSLEPAGLSFGAWAQAVAQVAPPQPRAERIALPADLPEGAHDEAYSTRIETQLGASDSAALHDFARARGLSLEALSLAALAHALAPLVAARELWVELEGHGRDALDGSGQTVDASRTIGWFTGLRSVAVTLPNGEPAERFVSAVARELAERAAERCYGRADVAFNFLGQWRAPADPEAWFELAAHPVGAERDPHTPRTHALEVDVVSIDGVLRFSYGYSAARYHAHSIEQIDQRVRAFLTALARERAGDAYPLSPLQQGLLFHSVWDDGRAAYVEQVSCRLEGALDLDALRASFSHVLEIHSVLRSVFELGVEEPTQRVLPPSEPALELQDLRALGEREQAAEIERSAARERTSGFDLARGPLSRVTLSRVGDERWVFLWTHHHLILDGWSAALVLRDLFASYEALRGGQPLPAAPRGSYRDYIAWLAARPRTNAVAFWSETLAGFEAATALPFSHTPRTGALGAQHVASRRVSSALTARLEAQARRSEVTLNTLLQAAWGFVLARAARSADVVFGITSAGRSAELEGIEQVAGLFINTLPLRLAVDDNMPVRGYLREVKARTAACLAHEHSPLAEARSYSAVPRGQPLFESLLVFENYPADARLQRGVAGLAVRDVSFQEETNYPLTLTVSPGQELALRVALDPRRFDSTAGSRLLRCLEHVLAELARAEEQVLGTISLAPAEEQRSQLLCQHATASDFGAALPVHEQIAARAAQQPDATALIFGAERVTYCELDARANQLAHVLRQRGVGRDDLVAVLAERSVELVVALLGVLKAGAAYVPIDPEYPRDRIELMLCDCSASILLSQWPVFARLGLPLGSVELLCLDSDRALLEAAPRAGLDLHVHPEQLAYTIYTSGSTGRPKGAGNTHVALCNRLAWMQARYQLSTEDRVLQKTPFSFDVSVWEFFWPLMTGAALVVAAPGDHRDPERLCELIARERVTTLHFVPPMLEAFLARATREACSSLRRVICSGEALSSELARRCLEQLDVELHNLYGPTEAAIDVSAWACERGADNSVLPIGHAIANTQLYVLDRAGQLAPDGVAGELCIGGVQLARGYHQRPVLTAERFMPDPFARVAGARLYRTGDLARRRSDGAFEFLGRIDHQVKIRGLRVELGEIEARLLAHPDVREAVVLARDGLSGKRLVAYVSGEVEPEALRAWVSQLLPAYMVPAHVVTLAQLPLSPNGKVERRALPEPELAAVQTAYVAPRNAIERTLCEVFAEVLRVPQVGIHDDFFALGGDSIVSLQVIARAAQRGISLTPKLLFENPSVAGAAQHAQSASVEAAPAANEAQAADADLSADAWNDLLAELER